MPENNETGPEDDEFPSSQPNAGDDDAGVEPERVSIWPLVATMDYLIHDLARLSPMSAYLMRMARQNLLDEHLRVRRPEEDDSQAGFEP